VAIVVSPFVSLFEYGAVWEVFGTDPEIGVPWYQVEVYSSSPPPIPTSIGGVSLDKVRPLESLRQADLVIVPPPSMASDDTLEALRQVHAKGARIASLCTGAFVLASAGLLDGRRATTHWENASRLAELHPDLDVDPSVLYIDEGDVLTSAGSAAGIDLCLHIVRGDYGADVANRVARSLVIPPHRDGGQAQFVNHAVPDIDEGDPFSSTLQWMEEHLAEPISVEDMAGRSAMSTRTLARRFRDTTGGTPHQWLLRRRLFLAQQLLESTDLSIDEVAWRCGLGSPTNLRVHFQRVVGTSPTAYRRTFRAEAG
jgi:AraC family transcriptional activator FtrA